MLINGASQNSIPANDRSVSFGDGVFTTFRIINGKIQYLAAHLQRLKTGCDALAIKNVAWVELELELAELAQQATETLMVGKAIITRGQGGRGYDSASVANPLRILSCSAFPLHVKTWREQGICLVWADLQLGIQPALAGHKTLNRLEQVLAKQELLAKGAAEGVFCNSNGNVVEACAANLFWRVGNVIYTPDLSLSGVNGIMRQQVIKYCREQRIELYEVAVPCKQLLKVDEMFISNSLLGVVPVMALENKKFYSNEFCRLLQTELDPLRL